MFAKAKIIFILIFAVILYYLPILINPKLLLERNNDLQEFFWPVFYYIKKQIEHGLLPLWNNLFLSGTPLLPDPQFSLFNPINLIFVLFPTNFAFIIYFILHSTLAALGMYLLGTKALNFSKTTSILVGILYLSTPKMAGFLEAGHLGLFASFAYLPFVLLALSMLIKTLNPRWVIALAISLAGIFYNHTVIFILTFFSVIVISLLYLTSHLKVAKKINSILLISLALLLTFGTVAITLLPQVDWLPQTTRFLLLQNRDIYPKWISIKEFLQIAIVPLSLGFQNLQNINSEKWISLGTTTLLLAGFGFIQLKNKFKILILLILIPCILVALNNASPIYKLLLTMDLYALMRVSTRVWFIPTMIIIILTGFALEKIIQKWPNKKIVTIIVLLVLTEQISLSYIYLSKPTFLNPNLAPDALYSSLKSDNEIYRVFCVNRCLSQQKAATYNLELMDGYNTLQQKNFYQQSWQLTGSYWNYYTLSIPPIGSYLFDKPQPDPNALGQYNTKYVISPYPLTNKDFIQITQIDRFLVYKNNLYQSRAYYETNSSKKDAKIIKYTPNQVTVDTTEHNSKNLTLSQVYNNGWIAYLDGTKRVSIQQKPNALMSVDLKRETKLVDFKYEPESFKFGAIITLVTTILAVLILKLSYRKK